MFKWLEPETPIEDLLLIAWHRMLVDPYITTYTFVDGREQRTYLNPKLAWKRALIDMAEHFQHMTQYIFDALIPAFGDVIEVFQAFAKNFEQYGLMSSITDEKGLELG